jgi:hypothetical protein
MILAALTGCSVVKGDSENKAYDTLSDLENATLGIITGTNYDNVAKEKFPNAERMYFSTSADVLLACVQVVLPQMISPFEMLVTIEYSEEQDDADVVLRYDGAAFDPMKTDNELSLLLAKKATENIVYSFDREQVLCNRVDAQI